MADLTTHKLLQRVSLNVDTASTVTFSSIPQTGYTDLKLVVSARGTQAAGYNGVTLKLNSDTANYTTKEVVGDGTNSSTASRNALGSAMYLGNISGNSATSKTHGVMEIYLPNYTSSNYKSVKADSVTENAASEAYITALVGLWSSTAAITTIEIVALSSHGTFMAGSTFSLYGISALGTTPSSPSADGGDIVVSDGSYWYHAFLNSGTFTPKTSLNCSAMVIAGGGGGNNGGGGAGGFRLGTGLSVTATAYPIVVGAGGSTAFPGSNSSFSTLSASGGGANGVSTSTTKNGGSGTGADAYGGVAGTGNAGGYTPVEGYGGGATGTYAAGGGGGAGGTGAGSPGTSQGGAGGVGAGGASYTNYAVINAMGAATKTGVLSSSHYYYAAGGGGGAGSSGPTAGAGGLGGGGTGGANTVGPWPGIMNTGSGGGGGWSNSGSSGGSGIVVIRYPVS